MSMIWKAAGAMALASGLVAAVPAAAAVTIESVTGGFSYGFNGRQDGGRLSMTNGSITYDMDGTSYTGAFSMTLSSVAYQGGITADSVAFALNAVTITLDNATILLGYNSGTFTRSDAVWSGLSAGSEWQSLTLGNLRASNVFVLGTPSSPFASTSDSVLPGNLAIAQTIADALSDYVITMSLDGGALPGGRPTTSFTFTVGAPPAVPEPASWALMIAGFGLTGAALRARRRSAALA